MAIDVLTVSSKGQIVLPAAIRKNMSIESGDKLAVYSSNDCIMLKILKIPTVEEFDKELKEAQAWAASVGYTEEDVDKIIKEVRQSETT